MMPAGRQDYGAWLEPIRRDTMRSHGMIGCLWSTVLSVISMDSRAVGTRTVWDPVSDTVGGARRAIRDELGGTP